MEPQERDRVVDLVRAACLIIVVGLHAFMAGITADGGRLSVFDATAGQSWFAALTWVVQIMPLFFLVGGFASITQLRRMRARGATATEYAHGRLVRLARPAMITFGTIAVGFGLASLLGVPGDLLAEVGFRMGQPMWFLGVYLGVSALVPVMARLHELAPRRTLAVLATGAVVVDLMRGYTGIEAVGYLNLAFVWLTIQQLGFAYADGWFRKLGRRRLVLGMTISLGLLIMVIGLGGYSPDLIVNLNPPTCSLLLLGVAQTCALTLASPALARFADRPIIRTCVDAVNRRAMTIYLWHMSVLVAVALLALAFGLPFHPAPSDVWWATRLPWLAAIGLDMIIVAGRLGRFEHGVGTATRRLDTTPLAMIIAVIVASSAVVTVLIVGFSVLSATLGTLGLAGALRIVTTRPQSTRSDQARLIGDDYQLSPVT